MATYEFTDLASETVSWSGKSGKMVAVVTLTRMEWDVLGNGHHSLVGSGHGVPYRTTITVTCDGKTVATRETLRTISGHQVAIGTIGRVGLNRSNYDLVKSAVDRCEEHPEHMAYLARVESGNKILDEADAREHAIDSTMTVGGRSY